MEIEKDMDTQNKICSEVDAVSLEAIHLPYSFTQEYFIEPIGPMKKRLGYQLVKRLFDVTVSAVGLLILFVPMCCIGIAVKCSSKGPVLYAQERLGHEGRKIRILKFRTMVEDAEKDGAKWCEEEDPRVTPVGDFLRKTHLDELPQLWNILVGDMSFVGPRPERECFYIAFEEYIHGFKERMKVVPGLTGLAQVSGGYRMPPQEKILYDIEYIKNRSVGLDLKIMFRTARNVLAGRE